ncbi:hypothetical protein B484DRAFT_454306 [Ochromonadaceae sp. CCMP2298]|nr:hypothetical protein B484DRAFT_454306 [Ochromonadaceae sp. CCMP2298]|mmetsp:Transcript_10335/g.22921  ORF Transcript_10335/g.22921 Transcript_10335/m.22921 type:complete len:146 (+) Transcript_10335:64-501(+)
MKEKAAVIPAGVPKSGRSWKVTQSSRSSAQSKKGVLTHLATTFEERATTRNKERNAKELEREMIEDKKRKKLDERDRRDEQLKRRQENEYKNSVYQQLNPEKLKSMSKKQLRSVRKTAVNKFGKVELVNPWAAKDAKSNKGAKRK